MNGFAQQLQSPADPAVPNREVLATIITAQRLGQGCLPNRLGLDAAAHEALMQHCFPRTRDAMPTPSSRALECGSLREELLALRRDEWQELHDLLLQHRRNRDISEHWLAAIIATACLGSEHLWRDLGLPSRTALKTLLETNFPALALRNDRDMRWKKFFYKQLCEQQGGYVCRSPSCEQCPTYQECFGDES